MKKRTVILIGIGAAALWTVWALAPFWLPEFALRWKGEAAGQWGDTFGALNAAFAAAAFIAVLRTIRMQAEEIADQQEQIDKQNRRLEISEFETTYFQLLELATDLRATATFGVPGDSRTNGEGRAAFEAAATHLQSRLFASYMYSSTAEEFGTKLAKTYEDEVHRHAEHSFGPYFRVLYTILRRISEKDKLGQEDKARYGNLIRSQLSSAEISIIAANALTEASNDFSDYVIEFRLLKYLPKGPYRSRLKEIYPPEAFAERDRVKRRRKFLVDMQRHSAQ